MSHPLLCVLVAFIFASPPVRADEEVTLPPIVKKGTPAEALSDDPILPVREGKGRLNSSSGSMNRTLGDELPFSLTDTGKPGQLAQFRGLGRSAEDTDVQALGIPLNSPQGGGFDFATFPQFLWQGYRFQMGPSLGAFEPRGVSGTVTLLPWTASAVENSGNARALASGFYSGAGISQVSAGAIQPLDQGASAALLAGFSAGDMKGPSGSFSAKREFGEVTARFHLLATDVEAKIPGSKTFPSPQAHQETARFIPVGQADIHLGGGALLKTSAFYDATFLRYVDPDSPSQNTRDHIEQAGVENALLVGSWKFGASVRQIGYQKIDFNAPTEYSVNLQASRSITWDSWQVEPTLQGVGVSRFGLLPAASVGIRRGLGSAGDSPDAVFLRGALSRRFPSLADRYYVISGLYEGNPNLMPEKDWTVIAGGEWKSSPMIEATLQGYVQLREDAQVSSTTSGGASSLTNFGNASVVAGIGDIAVKPLEWFTVSNSLTVSKSNITATGTEFPYLARWVDVLGVSVHGKPWEVRALGRISSSSTVSASPTADQLPGYGYLDLDAKWHFFPSGRGKGLSLSGRVDNVLDRPIELVKDYPLPGRTFSVLIAGEF